MKITNKLNLPDALVAAVKADPYTKGHADFSCTELLGPARKAALTERHYEELEDDVSDRLWAIQGQICHLILERANRVGFAEERLYGKFGKHTVSAQVDTLEFGTGILSDWKYQSAYKFKKYEVDPDWEAQLNIQAYLVRASGREVNELQIIGLLRDWSKGQAERDENYPQKPVAIVSIPLWTPERTEAFVLERIQAHVSARAELPLCTSQERWEKASVYAVMKKGNKRALKLCGDINEAAAMCVGHSELSVIHRPGESTRCKSYCNVSSMCQQYQDSLKGESNGI